MCGFTGWFDFSPPPREVLERMTHALQHRGPDDMGLYCRGPVGLGHQRLAIIDVAAGAQPMVEGLFALAYNGEIYNFIELREELKLLGHQFHTQCDTEVLFHALMEWKEGALSRLQGMFAFAFWDGETLLLARDPMGVKPLYICQIGRKWVFGSELKALLEHPAVSREIDLEAVGLYLECQYIPAPYSIYQKIRKLEAGHWLKIGEGVAEEGCYWMPNYEPKQQMGEEEAVIALEQQLRRSVRSMLVADVPVGAFVSGGVDSSLIAALMQQEGGKRIEVFSIGVEHEESEQKYAAQVAQYLGATFHPLQLCVKDFAKAMETVFDEPLGDQAALPTLLLSQWARPFVSVVLTGEGADEVFAGYSNYTKRLHESVLCDRYGFLALRSLYRLMPEKLRKNRLVKALSRPRSRRYTTIPSLYDSETHPSIFTKDLLMAQRGGLEVLAEKHFLTCESEDYLDRMLHIDQRLWLADDLLAKVDRSTMAHSLEARVPYLDHQLVEFAASLPSHLKLRGQEGKYLLKKVARQFLPHDIVYRPKRGFVMPLKEWIEGELAPCAQDALSEGGLLGRNLLRDGFREQNPTRLYALMSLEFWFRRYAPNYRL